MITEERYQIGAGLKYTWGIGPTGRVMELAADGLRVQLTNGGVNVKDPPFNAVGDGVTDDYAAIAAAIASGARKIAFPKGTFLISAPLAMTTAQQWCGEGRDATILRFTGTTSSGVVQVGFQGSNLSGVSIRDMQIDKTAGATTGPLMHVRGVQESEFTSLKFSNSAASTGATTDNIQTENCYVNLWLNILSNRAGRYGIHLKAQTAYNVDASNDNVFVGCAFEDCVSAGAYVINGTHNVFIGCTFEDFAAAGQHGIHLDGRATNTIIDGCYFEAQASGSNDIRITGSNDNGAVIIQNCNHQGGPTTEIYLDQADNCRVMNARSVATGTFAQVTANTDRAWFMGNTAGSATTYVNDAGTNTIVWGNKAGSPVMQRFMMENAWPIQGLTSAGAIKTLAVLNASNHVHVGDTSLVTWIDGTDVILSNATPAAVGAGQVNLSAGTQATIGANGAASAPTANPLGYLKINVAGTAAIIPYYNA